MNLSSRIRGSKGIRYPLLIIINDGSQAIMIDHLFFMQELLELQDNFKNNKLFSEIFGPTHANELMSEWLENPNIVYFFASLNAHDKRTLLRYLVEA